MKDSTIKNQQKNSQIDSKKTALLWDIAHIQVTTRGTHKKLLDIPKLQLPQGKIIAIIGPNGAGKSTLLKVLMGYYPHISVSCMGKEVADLVKKGRIAWVGQHERFDLPISVTDYVLLGCYPQLSWFSQPSKKELALVADYLQQFDLAEFAQKRIQSLSGGEKQRAAIVRAFIQKTQIMLFDEPTNHLDIRHQYRLMHFLKAQNKQHQTSIIMVLHDLNLAANFADDVILLDKGKLVGYGDVTTVMNETALSQVYEWQINKQQQGGQIMFNARI